MRNEQRIPQISVDEAYAYTVAYLRGIAENGPDRRGYSSYGYDLYIPRVIQSLMSSRRGPDDQYVDDSYRMAVHELSPVFYEAAWTLFKRGVLRPGVARSGSQSTDDGSAGDGFSLTIYGKDWLKEQGSHTYVPVEPGSFAKVLAGYAPRFGPVFHARAQEAFRCYSAHAYLGCAVMCGAAAEAIAVEIAVAQGTHGDREQVAETYLASRARIEKSLLGKQTDSVREQYKAHADVMKYWRDNSAHGLKTVVGEVEAHVALALLLRFAQFVDSRWGSLTAT